MKRNHKKLIHQLQYLYEVLEEERESLETGKIDLIFRVGDLLSAGALQNPDVKSQELSKADAIDKKTEKIVKPSDRPKWVKKIYRKIVHKSHPDKLINESDEDHDHAIKLYRRSVESYESSDYVDLLMCAFSLGIHLQHLGPDVLQLISAKIHSIETDIGEVRSSSFWIWNNISHEKKIDFLRNYVRERGCDDDTIAEVRKILCYFDAYAERMLFESFGKDSDSIVEHFVSSLFEMRRLIKDQLIGLDSGVAYRRGTSDAIDNVCADISSQEGMAKKKERIVEKIKNGEDPEKRAGVGEKPERLSTVRRIKSEMRDSEDGHQPS